MMHYSERDDKPGRKMFSWALSDQGDIWEELLTDNAGQYVELQSGRLFNQNMVTSVLTPYKQTGFAPYGTDMWTEYWFPYHGTEGAADVTLKGVVNLKGTESGTENPSYCKYMTNREERLRSGGPTGLPENPSGWRCRSLRTLWGG